MSRKYTTRFEPGARAELLEAPRRSALAILRKLAEIETDPLGFGATALVGSPETRRLRLGSYRVLYTIDNGELVVWVVQVGHRSTVYGSH